ncbi:IMP dehydrogenase, partial [Micrococcus luteus]
PELIERIQSGEIQPGRVFTARMPLDDAAEAYRAMDERREIKVLLEV